MSVSPAPASPPAPDPRQDVAAAPAESCVSCGRPAGTPFCPHCGERRAADRRYSLLHFAHEAAEALLNTDGTLLRTLRTLLLRPGELTAAYMRGRRVGYLRPFQLFLVLNVAYFLVATWTGARVFDTPLSSHMNSVPHRGVATRLVRARLAARNITIDRYRATFDSVSTAQAKSLIILMVPAFALFVALVGARHRRYAVQHLVFAVHAFAALLIILVAVGGALEIPIRLWIRWRGSVPPWQVQDAIVSIPIVMTFGVYVAFALRRAYGDGPWAATAKAAILCAGLAVVLQGYRFVLFFTTLWST